jgi:HTH-type transcriptional regulator/antitoxin HigA
METTLRPFRPIKPGEILEEELEARGWSPADFAYIIGRSNKEINDIIAAKRTITPAAAVAFSETLSTSREYWLNLEAAYKLDSARQA